MAKKTKEEEFTTRIKELRARYNLTQSDLAKMVNARRETILYIEKGKYNPSLVLAHKISKALNSKIDEVFLFADDHDTNPI
ncbi:MAG: transcriptional regulator [Promethearchaeota archaeon Loki_b32]|nr:MAG: transcriptional regulator [Candidatus Lokiarchaeota archaeon Loki_b32]